MDAGNSLADGNISLMGSRKNSLTMSPKSRASKRHTPL
jgi:hypothetical protein